MINWQLISVERTDESLFNVFSTLHRFMVNVMEKVLILEMSSALKYEPWHTEAELW